jgi:hypothetical protein
MKVKVKVKVSPCFNSAPRYESVLGSGGRYPRIIDLGIRWRLVVRFAVRPLYRQGKSPWYPLYRRLGGPRAGLDAAVRRKISSPYRESIQWMHQIKQNLKWSINFVPVS